MIQSRCEVVGVNNQQQNGFLVVNGTMEHIGGRCVALDGVGVEVPRMGQAYIGAVFFVEDGVMRTRACQFFGEKAARYSLFSLGDKELGIISEKCVENGGNAFPYGFISPHPRPRISMN